MQEGLQGLICMLRESLERDEEMSKDLRPFIQENDSKNGSNEDNVNVNQNLGLEDLIGALKECMKSSIVAIERVAELVHRDENTDFTALKELKETKA